MYTLCPPNLTRSVKSTACMERDLADVFIYTWEGGAVVPDDVARVRVDASVTLIPANAFGRRIKLTEVELCEGLIEIGHRSFELCDHSITKINIPTSLRRINDYAFRHSLRCTIRLHDGIETLEKKHSVAASSPTLDSHPSSP